MRSQAADSFMVSTSAVRLTACCNSARMIDPGHRRNRQRGFSLIVVFLLILVMVGVSAAVMLSTQGDLQVSGHDREAVSALYAAEAGAAWGQNLIYGYASPVKDTAWDAMLKSVGAITAAFCVVPLGGGNPPTALPVAAAVAFTPGSNNGPAPGAPVLYDPARLVYFQWCVHNNASDKTYTPPGAAAGNTADKDNIVTIESWGWVGGTGTLASAIASSHITIDVAYTANVSVDSDYQQAGGVGARKLAGGENSPSAGGGLMKVF